MKLNYTIHIQKPHLHYYEVELKVPSKSSEVELVLPAWTPGSYMIRDYSSHIHIQSIVDEDGQSLKYEQRTTDSWVIQNKNKSFTIFYRVYAHERSVRTNYLGSDYGFINPPATFMYIAGKLNSKVKIKFRLGNHFRYVYSSAVRSGKDTFEIANMDLLYDSPFLLTNVDSFSFTSGGCEHEIVIQGDIPESRKKQLVIDLEKITSFEINYLGGTQNSYYLFMIDFVEAAYGGLEHAASSVNMFDPYKLHEKDEYLKLLSLLAHEYFHLWNGKRLRPLKIGPFNYQSPILTGELWMIEGITSYYDNYILLLAGYFTPEIWLGRVMSDMQLLENSTGEDWMSLEESSLTTWNKFYKAHGDSHNTNISYYVKGALLVLCMDIRILVQTAGKKRFIDVIRDLYVKYYLNEDRGITREEFYESALRVTGVELKKEFDEYIAERKRIPVMDYLRYIGVDRLNTDETTDFGFQIHVENGKSVIKRIYKQKNVQTNINLGDELIAINGIRVSDSNLEYLKNMIHPGEKAELILARKGKVITAEMVPSFSFRQSVLFFQNGVSEEILLFRSSFLNKH